MEIDQTELQKYIQALKRLNDGTLKREFASWTAEEGERIRAKVAKRTPTVSGQMKKSWRLSPLRSESRTFSVTIYNTARSEKTEKYPEGAPYPKFFERGHRIVNKSGQTVGYKDGYFILKKSAEEARRSMKRKSKKRIKELIKKELKH